MFNLSIIIPHYNSIEFLKKLLDTIPQKDDIQIIVVDDRSDKNIDELNLLTNNNKNKNMSIIKNDSNKKGAGVCRNIGLNKAEGKWILFADSDDFFVGDFYDQVKDFFSSNYQVVFFKPTSIEIDTGDISDRHLPYEKLISNFLKKNDLQSEIFLRYSYFVPWSKLVRKSFLLENNIIFDEVLASNDVMFSTKIGYHMQKFYVSKEVLYCVTRSRGSLTTNTSVEVYDSRLMIFIRYYNFLKLKLDNSEWKILNLNGSHLLLSAMKYKFKLKKILIVYLQFKKNKIKVLDLRLINPIFVIEKIYYKYGKYKKEKRFLS